MDKYTCFTVAADNRDLALEELIEAISLGSQSEESWDEAEIEVGGNDAIQEEDQSEDDATDPEKTDATDMIEQIVKMPTFPKAFTVFIEAGYVDKIYRDIYYHHYSSRHFSQPRNCQRLFFFEGISVAPNKFPENATDRFIGVCVVQPNGIIGRSYWNPKYFLPRGHYVRTTDFTVMLLGKYLHIKAFPHMMQDREATTCAEVTVLNLIDYYSQSYTEYRSTLLSDIESVEAQHSAERIFPSQGMNYADVARSLAYVGLSPRIYASRVSAMIRNSMRRYLYYYVESGIPFGVAVESTEQGVLHSMVCVGHGPKDTNWPTDCAVNYLSKEIADTGATELRTCWIANSADAYQTFVVMDDNDTPYQTVHLETASNNWTYPRKQADGLKKYAVEQLCVPLYKRVFLEVDGAVEVFATFLTSQMGFRAVMERNGLNDWSKVGETKDSPLIVRVFLASSRTFLSQRMQALSEMESQAMDNECGKVYQNLFCPRFVWVCELYTKETFEGASPKAIGEIVVDATARRTGGLGGVDGIVLVHYPYYITYRGPNSRLVKLEHNERLLEVWSPIKQFRGNLQDFNE